MKFSIIIVNYNLSKEIENCVNSILLHLSQNDYEIIIVDNDSKDRSILEIVEKTKIQLGDRFSYLQLDSNYGFGWACNHGSKNAKGDILFFLNPDTTLNGNILPYVKEIFQKRQNDVGVVGLRTSKSNYLDYSAGYFPNITFELLNILSLGRYCEALYIGFSKTLFKKIIMNTQWIMGAAIFVEKKLFNSVGGFDEIYFLYFEEMDLCKKIYDLKRTNLYLPNISVNHLGSVSTKKNYYLFTKMFYKGKLLFINKHYHGFYKITLKQFIKLHIYGQLIIWKYLKNKDYEKSDSKIRAFKELLNNINNPSNIRNI